MIKNKTRQELELLRQIKRLRRFIKKSPDGKRVSLYKQRQEVIATIKTVV